MKRLTRIAVVVLAVLACVGAVRADMLAGLSDITVQNGEIVSIEYAGTTYGAADLGLGTTTRWYVVDSVETLWVDGEAAPAATVTTTSNPKVGDIGAHADDFLFTRDGATDISSIDGIDFQLTIFPFLTDTIFVFERGGNDAGTFQAIMPDGSLGSEVAFAKGTDGGPYADTGVSANGQNAWGVVFTTDVPVMGLRINASGHDALSVSAVPEPASLALLALGGLALLRRRR